MDKTAMRNKRRRKEQKDKERQAEMMAVYNDVKDYHDKHSDARFRISPKQAYEMHLQINKELFKESTGINERKLKVYVLTNFDSTLDEDLYRVYTLRELGYDPYIMIYQKQSASRKIRVLQRWVNNKRVFKKVLRFEDFNPRIA